MLEEESKEWGVHGFSGVLSLGGGRIRSGTVSRLPDRPGSAVVLFMAGDGLAVCGDMGLDYLPGSLVAVRTAADLRIFPSALSEYEYIMLRNGSQLLDPLCQNGLAVRLAKGGSAWESFTRYVQDGGWAGGRDIYRASAELYQILMELMAAGADRPAGPSPLVTAAAGIMETEYDRLAGLDSMAARLGVGRSHLIRRFSAEMGQTPGRFLQQVRLKAACRLLEQGTVSLEEVARRTGYANANYFCKVFRAAMHQTPGEYRKQVKSLR